MSSLSQNPAETGTSDLKQEEKVKAFIKEQIRQNPDQAISFTEFMQHALFAPDIGYYTGSQKKFGAEGDFVTAPEISPLFSQCMARQAQQVLEVLADGVIVEFGAGSGQMAKTILEYLAKQNKLPDAYYIIEISPDLQKRQQILLQQLPARLYQRVRWLKQMPIKPVNAVILANEVLDAMPCHRIHIRNGEYYEYFVTMSEDHFAWHRVPIMSEDLIRKISELDIGHFPDYTTEINLNHATWLENCSQSLNQGMFLIIDYGYPEREYYHPERTTGTLKCFFKHRQHDDPLILTGIQDMTSHVDFTALAQKAAALNLEVAGYAAQGGFLIDCGIETLLQLHEDEISRVNATQQIKKLILPDEMGELFKVMALSRKMDLEPVGFRNFDRTIQL